MNKILEISLNNFIKKNKFKKFKEGEKKLNLMENIQIIDINSVYIKIIN